MVNVERNGGNQSACGRSWGGRTSSQDGPYTHKLPQRPLQPGSMAAWHLWAGKAWFYMSSIPWQESASACTTPEIHLLLTLSSGHEADLPGRGGPEIQELTGSYPPASSQTPSMLL